MNTESNGSNNNGWLRACGLCHILRTLGFAVHPAKLGIAFLALLATLVWGGLLDSVWSFSGGIEQHSITRFISARENDQDFQSQEGKHGVFAVWQSHQRRCVQGLLSSSLPGSSIVSGTPVGAYLSTHAGDGPLRSLTAMVCGTWWMARYHTAFFILLMAGVLLIWSLCGGAICRIAAVQFAHDERITSKEAFSYVRPRLLSSFFLAPCIPLLFVMVGAVVMALSGLILRLPLLGDIIGGVAFGFAVLGGFVLAALILGSLAGGSLFWPGVAVEGADAFDAFSRALSYVFSKPWKAMLYAAIACVFGGLCWVLANVFTFFALALTRTFVSFGASPFGAFSRGAEGEALNKLDLIWPIAGADRLYVWPDWSRLTWYEHISAFLIAAFILTVFGLLWSFLASFYLSGSTIIYFLLRHDVDRTDLEDLYCDENEDEFRIDSHRVKSSNAAPSEASMPVAKTTSELGVPPSSGEAHGPTQVS